MAIEDFFNQMVSGVVAEIDNGTKTTVKSSIDQLQESDNEAESTTAGEKNNLLVQHDTVTKKADNKMNGAVLSEFDSSLNTDLSIPSASNQEEQQIEAEQLLVDSLEHELAGDDHELPFDDAMLLNDNSQAQENGEQPSTHFEGDPDKSYNQIKCSIDRISDAIENKEEIADLVGETKKSNNPFTEASSTNSDVASQGDNMDFRSKITNGSRIIVRWGNDGDLYKATVKKVLMDRGDPTIKIHYDGKKSHIVDSISLDMVVRFIAESEAVPKHKHSCLSNIKRALPDVSIKELLRGKYQHSLPSDKLELREQCPELGPGWSVYITARRNQNGKNNNQSDRYFISPSGKTCRSMNELEKYRVEHPEEFDLCIVENGPDDLTNDKSTSLPKTNRYNNSRVSPALNAKRKTDNIQAIEDLKGSHTSHTEVKADESQAARGLKGRLTNDAIDRTDKNQTLGDMKRALPQCQTAAEKNLSITSNADGHVNNLAHDEFSPLMIGQSGPPIEESHSDHEFFSSLMDEKGLIFDDDDLEEDLSSFPAQDQNDTAQTSTAETLQACNLKPVASCMKCPSPILKVEDNDNTTKKNVHFAEEELTLPDKDKGEAKDAPMAQTTESKKKGLSRRMKHNKKELVLGIVPLFAMDVATGAEFAGYLGDAQTDADSDSESDDENPGPPTTHRVANVKSEASQYSHQQSPAEVHDSSTSSLVQISPISLHCTAEGVAKNPALSCDVPRPKPKRPTNSPNEVAAINMKPTHSAFVAVPRSSQHGSAQPILPPSSSIIKKVPSESKKSDNVQLFAFEYDSGGKDETSTRPKRKLKATVRYDPDMANDSQSNGCKTGSGFICPRCDFVCDYGSKICSGCGLECYYEAGVGVVSLKDRESLGDDQSIAPRPKRSKLQLPSRPEGVLCNCTYCDRSHFSIQGIYAHHGRAHGESEGTKLDWSKVTFSCPFCRSSEIYTLSQVEKHVRDCHPGCELVTPNVDRPPRNRSRVNKITILPPQQANTRVTRTRHQADSSTHHVESPETVPKWFKLDHRTLLRDCKKDYPRGIPNILDLVEEQCKAQEEVIKTAYEQRIKVCKLEAEADAKLLDDDRLAYQRGIRERSRHADAERIEKQKFTESQQLMVMQYEYQNRNRKRTKDEIEVDKLCSKPIVFSGATGRHYPREKNACNNDQCELCKDDSLYLRSIMLDNEIESAKKDDPSSQSLLPKAHVLQPFFKEVSKNYLSQAEEDYESKEEKVKQNRRDVATSKRVQVEEDKLFKMRSNQRDLEFVARYNMGLIQDAWKTPR